MNGELEQAIERLEKQLHDDEWFHIEAVGRKVGMMFTVSISIGEEDPNWTGPEVISTGPVCADVVGRALDELHACRRRIDCRMRGVCISCEKPLADCGLCADPTCDGSMPF